MALVSIKDLHLTFGHPPLFEGAELHIEDGDRVCLLGRNGTGKSTLLKLIAGIEEPDSGSVALARGLRVTYVHQEMPGEFEGSAAAYCEHAGANPLAARKALTQFGIDPEAPFAPMSGGARRRVALAAGIAHEADLLLLDEPTNHLDVHAIAWLEEYLVRSVRTLVLVTHDRAFARAVTTRVAQIDRGIISSFDTDFDSFVRLRDEQLQAADAADAKADKLRAQEEAWLRRGVRARRTRDEGRVKALMRMREEYAARRSAPGEVRITVAEAGRSGTLVLEATNLTFGYGDGPAVVAGLTTTIYRGDTVGIVGPNGAGKTTLVKLLLGELEPSSGRVRRGVGLEPLYLDQMRGALQPELSVVDNISGGDDTVVIGARAIHINAYLQQFLFEPTRARMPVGFLSGGEQNRVLLAKLFTQRSNLLVLDEPTNDLDLETLDILEQMLVAYSGSVLLVTHDREFLDRVVTSSLVLTGDGTVREFPGGYTDWKDQAPWMTATSAVKPPEPARPRARDRAPKRSYKENQELAALPDRIAGLESQIETLQHALADPELYARAGSDGSEVRALTSRLERAHRDLAVAYERWEELEAKEG